MRRSDRRQRGNDDYDDADNNGDDDNDDDNDDALSQLSFPFLPSRAGASRV